MEDINKPLTALDDYRKLGNSGLRDRRFAWYIVI